MLTLLAVRKPEEFTMNKLVAVLALLTLVFGPIALAGTANASKTYLFQANQNEGANN